MKFLIFGDLLGKKNIVKKLSQQNLRRYDFLIYTGDIPDPSVFKHLREVKVQKGINENTDIEKELIKDTMPYNALKKATKEVEDIVNILLQLKKPIYGVLGNADLKYYSQFVSWPFILLHNKIETINDYHLIGYNGRPLYIFEESNDNENAFSEIQVQKDLDRLFQQVDPRKTILITHAPPFGLLDKVKKEMRQYAIGTYGNKAKNGNLGSLGILRVIEKYKPLLHIFGHIHENEGIIKNETTFINTGSTGETNRIYIRLKCQKVCLN